MRAFDPAGKTAITARTVNARGHCGRAGRRLRAGPTRLGGQCGGQPGEEDVQVAFEFGSAIVRGQNGTSSYGRSSRTAAISLVTTPRSSGFTSGSGITRSKSNKRTTTAQAYTEDLTRSGGLARHVPTGRAGATRWPWLPSPYRARSTIRQCGIPGTSSPHSQGFVKVEGPV